MKKVMFCAMTVLTLAATNAPALVGAATNDASGTETVMRVKTMKVLAAKNLSNGDEIFGEVTYSTSVVEMQPTLSTDGKWQYYNYKVDGVEVKGQSLIQ